jgi:hypothetical protein
MIKTFTNYLFEAAFFVLVSETLSSFNEAFSFNVNKFRNWVFIKYEPTAKVRKVYKHRKCFRGRLDCFCTLYNTIRNHQFGWYSYWYISTKIWYIYLSHPIYLVALNSQNFSVWKNSDIGKSFNVHIGKSISFDLIVSPWVS